MRGDEQDQWRVAERRTRVSQQDQSQVAKRSQTRANEQDLRERSRTRYAGEREHWRVTERSYPGEPDRSPVAEGSPTRTSELG